MRLPFGFNERSYWEQQKYIAKLENIVREHDRADVEARLKKIADQKAEAEAKEAAERAAAQAEHMSEAGEPRGSSTTSTPSSRRARAMSLWTWMDSTKRSQRWVGRPAMTSEITAQFRRCSPPLATPRCTA